MKSRVLITGGFGYVGGRLTDHFVSRGHGVIVASRRTAPPAWVGPPVETRNFDYEDRGTLQQGLKGVETVIHLAAMNEIECAADPERAVTVNTLYALRLLREAITAGVSRFVYFSTAHVYGSPFRGVLTEETLPRPSHPYAISHKNAEDYLLAAIDRREIAGSVARLSNGFGAPMDRSVDRWTLLVNDLCRQAALERKMTLKSSGMQWRDFIPLKDVCEATELLCAPKREEAYPVFNIGSGQAMRVLEMAQLIARVAYDKYGIDPKLEILKEPTTAEMQDPGFKFSVDRLASLGFHSSGSAEAEIARTLSLCLK